ncbi:MAG: tRNA1(Val) (adenine(37)-N6)-methyltransferase [Eubacteriales bacterium]|nr:tRNA1(Val) (adenine(37)-N6)-methyltransferase [Eubacteriales bacterium]
MKYKNVEIFSGERVDSLERNGYEIIQNEKGFCFGMDAVLLSAFAKVKKGEIAIDLGTGTGIIPILLEAKNEGKLYFGVEIQSEVYDMAKRSVEMNGISDKVHILCGDIKQIAEKRQLSETDPYNENDEIKDLFGKFNVVTSNPPYMRANNGKHSIEEFKAISRHEVKCNLEDVCRAASNLLKDNGRFYMVHRPLRLVEIVSALKKYRLEPKRIKFVHPFIENEANMVLIEAIKGAKGECRIEKPIIVYSEPGKYTEEILEIYGF